MFLVPRPPFHILMCHQDQRDGKEPEPLPDAADSCNVIFLPLISRLCAPRSSPASLALIDSALIWLVGEVGSNGINDGVHALLPAAKVTHGDPSWPPQLPVSGQVWVLGTYLTAGILAARFGTLARTDFSALEPELGSVPSPNRLRPSGPRWG